MPSGVISAWKSLLVTATIPATLLIGACSPRRVKNNLSELDKLIRVGEPAYLAEKDHEARELVEQHPLRFAGLTLRRILYTWTGFWDFSPRSWLDDSGLPNILMYSLISLLAWTGLVWAIHDGRDGVVPLAILVVCFPWSITSPIRRFAFATRLIQ